MLKIFIIKAHFIQVTKNSFPIIEKLSIINTRKRAKKIPTYDFSTLYISIPYNLLVKVLSEIIHLVFKSKVGKLDFQQLLYIGLPKV